MSTAFARLAQTLSAVGRPSVIEKLLQEILTPGEVHDLGLRWELIELLADGVSQRQIASRLGISLCKITRGAKILKKSGGAVAAIAAKNRSGAAQSRTGAQPAASRAGAVRASSASAAAKRASKAPARKASAPARPAASGKTVPPAASKAGKSVKKVVGKHGTRVTRKSKDQVRR